mmetsp:Transcript_9000/g.18460  ORF Transcript_9000/g.18460 Transcript_9000/m.18460 type:complete len:220 (+) Transcript_9000:961-1620(+)
MGFFASPSFFEGAASPSSFAFAVASFTSISAKLDTWPGPRAERLLRLPATWSTCSAVLIAEGRADLDLGGAAPLLCLMCSKDWFDRAGMSRLEGCPAAFSFFSAVLSFASAASTFARLSADARSWKTALTPPPPFTLPSDPFDPGTDLSSSLLSLGLDAGSTSCLSSFSTGLLTGSAFSFPDTKSPPPRPSTPLTLASSMRMMLHAFCLAVTNLSPLMS